MVEIHVLRPQEPVTEACYRSIHERVSVLLAKKKKKSGPLTPPPPIPPSLTSFHSSSSPFSSSFSCSLSSSSSSSFTSSSASLYLLFFFLHCQLLLLLLVPIPYSSSSSSSSGPSCTAGSLRRTAPNRCCCCRCCWAEPTDWRLFRGADGLAGGSAGGLFSQEAAVSDGSRSHGAPERLPDLHWNRRHLLTPGLKVRSLGPKSNCSTDRRRIRQLKTSRRSLKYLL